MDEKHGNTDALYAWIPSDVNSLRHKDFIHCYPNGFSTGFLGQIIPLLMANCTKPPAFLVCVFSMMFWRCLFTV
jgi:hypothetical protein